VELLAEEELKDPDYVDTFIATHNYFLDSQSFMSRFVTQSPQDNAFCSSMTRGLWTD